MAFILRWGIVGAGRISSTFVSDLVLDPGTRDVTDVFHAVTAVGSRSIAKAEEFIGKFCPDGASAQKAGLLSLAPSAKGSYEEVYRDEVIIGSPYITSGALIQHSRMLTLFTSELLTRAM